MILDFTHVDALSKELASLRPLNQGELKRLRDEFMIQHTYDSNAIEGNTITLRETALILQQGLTIAEKPIKEHLEIIGYKDAFEYIMDLASQNTPLTEKTVKDIHTLVLMDDAPNRGVYRNVPVLIVGALQTPPSPLEVPFRMEQLLKEYESIIQNMHIIEAVAMFHLKFEGIHPFVDGNGRTGRLIMNLELVKHGLLPINVKFADRLAYYNSFDEYYGEPHSCEGLAKIIMKYELEELTKRIGIIKSN